MTTTFIEPIDATLVCAHPPSAPALASKRLYRLKAGERIGPYSFREIAQYIGATRFAPDEMIWHERAMRAVSMEEYVAWLREFRVRVVRHGKFSGPYGVLELAAMLARGEIAEEDLAMLEGGSTRRSLAEVFAQLEARFVARCAVSHPKGLRESVVQLLDKGRRSLSRLKQAIRRLL